MSKWLPRCHIHKTFIWQSCFPRLRHFAAQFTLAINTTFEWTGACRKETVLNVYKKWVDTLMMSKTSSFEENLKSWAEASFNTHSSFQSKCVKSIFLFSFSRHKNALQFSIFFEKSRHEKCLERQLVYPELNFRGFSHNFENFRGTSSPSFCWKRWTKFFI